MAKGATRRIHNTVIIATRTAPDDLVEAELCVHVGTAGLEPAINGDGMQAECCAACRHNILGKHFFKDADAGISKHFCGREQMGPIAELGVEVTITDSGCRADHSHEVWLGRTPQILVPKLI